MIKPKYKIGDCVIIRYREHLVMERISKGLLAGGGKFWEYWISDNRVIGWVKESQIISKVK